MDLFVLIVCCYSQQLISGFKAVSRFDSFNRSALVLVSKQSGIDKISQTLS